MPFAPQPVGCFEREKDFTAYLTFLSIGFCNFHRFLPFDCLSPFVSVALALGDEGYHTKSPHMGQLPFLTFLKMFPAPSVRYPSSPKGLGRVDQAGALRGKNVQWTFLSAPRR
jgi:hypothetical protein